MNEDNRATIEDIQKYVTPGLQVRIVLYFIIATVMIGIAAYHIAKDDVELPFPILGTIIGILLGGVVTRINKITWDHGAQQVITRLDAFGICILIIYANFEIYRNVIVGYFVHGPSVIATGFSILAGVMVGRILGIQRKISQHLNDNLF